MTLKELKDIGRERCAFLALFAGCFASLTGRRLLKIYVQGQLSDLKNKKLRGYRLEVPPASQNATTFSRINQVE